MIEANQNWQSSRMGSIGTEILMGIRIWKSRDLP
jgi:hypothetical protein